MSGLIRPPDVISRLRLVPAGAIVPFVVSITPSEFLDLDPYEVHDLPYVVVWRGIDSPDDQLAVGVINAVATDDDTGHDVVVASKPVIIRMFGKTGGDDGGGGGGDDSGGDGSGGGGAQANPNVHPGRVRYVRRRI